MKRIAFVIEQTLGHVAHTRNIERALAREESAHFELVKVPFAEREGWRRLPGVGSWSVAASLATRRALARLERDGPLTAAFIHTQVASLFSVPFMRRVPTVISLDATPVHLDAEGAASNHRRNPEPVERLKLEINRRSFKAAFHLVCWSQHAARSLESDYAVAPDRISVIPPGVDTSLFRPLESPRPEGPVRVLFVGGDFVRKGGPDLVAAMGALSSRAELDVVSGADIPAPPAGVVMRVHRGLKPQSPELVDLFRRADVFALPTHGDCLAQAVVEAMACGVPVVSTSVGAIPELIQDGVNGYLLAAGDVGGLRDAIERLATDAPLRARLGAHALRSTRAAHDAMNNNGRIVSMLMSMP